jgi:hypothetical protein
VWLLRYSPNNEKQQTLLAKVASPIVPDTLNKKLAKAAA